MVSASCRLLPTERNVSHLPLRGLVSHVVLVHPSPAADGVTPKSEWSGGMVWPPIAMRWRNLRIAGNCLRPRLLVTDDRFWPLPDPPTSSPADRR